MSKVPRKLWLSLERHEAALVLETLRASAHGQCAELDQTDRARLGEVTFLLVAGLQAMDRDGPPETEPPGRLTVVSSSDG